MLAFTLLVTTGLQCPGGGGGGQPTTCETDDDCDDGRFCNGEETCGTNGRCEDGTPPCPAEECVENADFCPECFNDTEAEDCDDDNPCTDDVCNDQRRCENVNNTDECDDDNECTSDDACDGGECSGTPNTDPCDDGDACTEDDACDNGECAGTPIECPDGETCNPVTGECEGEPVGCTTDEDCDDGEFCNGEETCGTNGVCGDGADPCAAGVECDEDNDFCQEACTDDTDCDDGLFCNGAETCGTSGFCEAGIGPCSGTETCDEDNDDCVPEVQECTTNGDCGGDACNPQVCEIGTNGEGTCVAGESPCADDETCEIGDDGDPVCIPAPGVTINFTQSPSDNLVGTSADDTFSGPVEVTQLGAQVNTFHSGDIANGLAGADILNAQYINGNVGDVDVTLQPTLNGIETLNLTDFGPDFFGNAGGSGGTAISGINFTGVTTVNNDGSQVNVTVNNLNALTDLGLFNSDADLNVTYISPAGSGNADSHTLTLRGARDSNPATAVGAAVNITTPANGFETLNVVSTGSTENILEALNQIGGTTLQTLNVSGSAELTIRRDAPLPATLTTINAGSATGGTDLTVGGALNVTYTGGAGDDVINFAGTYTTSDIINGGAGTNTLGLNAAQAAVVTNQANVSNIQTLMIVNTLLGETVDVTRFGATDAILDTTAAALLLNLPSNITLGSGNRTITFNNDDINDQLNITVSGVGTSDTLTMNFFNADQSFAATQIDTIGAETVTVVSGNGLDGTAADGNVNQVLNLDMAPTTGGGTLNITGGVPFTVLQGITAGTVNASGAGAAFTMETTSATLNVASGSVTGSPFNDELTGGAGNDSIAGGEGNDLIKGNNGSDVTSGGGGADHFFFDAVAHFGAALNHATPEVISDLTAGTDKVGLGSGIINFAGVAGTEAAPVALTSGDFETGRSAITGILAGDANKIVRISAELTGADIDTTTGAAVAAYVLVFDSTAQRGFLVHDDNWGDAANRRFVRLENITTNAQLQVLTFTDFEEID